MGPDDGDEGSAADLARLQGVWEQLWLEEDGVRDPPDSHGAPGARTVIAGTTFTVTTAEGAVLLRGRFELEAGHDPKAITWIDAIGADAGKRLPASYILDGDRFVFIAADEGVRRPTVFRTRPGLTMRAFVRVG